LKVFIFPIGCASYLLNSHIDNIKDSAFLIVLSISSQVWKFVQKCRVSIWLVFGSNIQRRKRICGNQ